MSVHRPLDAESMRLEVKPIFDNCRADKVLMQSLYMRLLLVIALSAARS